MNDLLNRTETAERIFKIIKNQDANVFSINAPWGAGKTFFLGLLEEEAKQSAQEVVFIKYNAWESDFADHPMLPLILELKEQLLNFDKSDRGGTKAFWNKSTRILNKLVKASNFSVKLSTSKLMPVDITAIASLETKKLLEKESSPYLEYKKAKDDFQTFLKKLTTHLKKKIIICIDELDRCQPIYAIRTLEVLKHFFQQEGEDLGVKFVLAVDKQQMQNTIKTIYGIDANTECYLRKFIDVEFFLPQPTLEDFIKYQFSMKKYADKTIEQRLVSIAREKEVLVAEFTRSLSNCNSYSFPSSNNVLDSVILSSVSYIQTFKLELRDIEKLCLKLNIILTHIDQSSKDTTLFFDLLFVWLSLQVKNSHSFHELKNLSKNQLSKYVDEDKVSKSSYFVNTPRLSNFYNFLNTSISYKEQLEQKETSSSDNLESTKTTLLSNIGIDTNKETVRHIEGWVYYPNLIDFVSELG